VSTVLNERTRSIISWALTIGGGIVLGAVAARFRLLESTAVLFGLYVLCALLVGLGIWAMCAMSQPWGRDDDE
jgi:hypothetical protein